jgi:phosphatidylserine/phosphatidylglycerophosphate/cardiolipin synthase-like enzyme
MEGISLLNTLKLIEDLRKMFYEENKRLIIISPFNDFEKNTEIIQLLSESKARIHFLYKLPESKKDIDKIEKFKKELNKINYFEIENLHAKAYISNKESIITSFNLNANNENFELGLKFDNTIHSGLYKDMIEEIKKLLKSKGHDENSIEETHMVPDITS